MTIRIATFNMENLFRRPKMLDLAEWKQGRPALKAISALNALLRHDTYSDQDKQAIAEILAQYRIGSGATDTLFHVNQVRGKLFKTRNGTGEIEVVAKGREDWAGWVEVSADELDWEATVNTGRVVDAIRPDILLCVEVEDRHALQRFNDHVLHTSFPGTEFPYNVLVDGNDIRGINIGILSRFPITSVRNHIFDCDGGSTPVFSRDCPEYEIALPDGKTLWVLGNHFKSKGYGNPTDSNARRLRQARTVNAIYRDALQRSDWVIVAGDLNDTPDSDTLRVLADGTGLRDVMTSGKYKGKPGTYGTGNTLSGKIDYLMLSPAMWRSLASVDVERRGVHAPRSIESFPTVTSKTTEASDHAALYADLET